MQTGSIKKSFGVIFLLFLLQMPLLMKAQSSGSEKKMEWWKDAKFGMFMHWGLYSQTAGDWRGKPAKGSEHFMLYEQIPWKEYAEIAKDFNPVKLDADKWVPTAINAWMKYLVITSKHHDGFAMFDSPASDYNIL